MIISESHLRYSIRKVLIELDVSAASTGKASSKISAAGKGITSMVKKYMEVGGDDNEDFCGIMTSVIRMLASDDAKAALKNSQYSDIYASDTSLRKGIIKLAFDLVADSIKSLMSGIEIEKDEAGNVKISAGLANTSGAALSNLLGQIDGAAGKTAKVYVKKKVAKQVKNLVKKQVKKKWFSKFVKSAGKAGATSAITGPISTAISVGFLAMCTNRLEAVADEEVKKSVRLASLVPDVEGASKGTKVWASGLNLPSPKDFKR